MSYGVPPIAAPTPRPRPNTVTVAGMLLYGLAGLTVINAIISIATLSTTLDAAKDAYSGVANGDAAITAARIAGIAGIVIALIFAALWVVLAVGNLRGRNGLRITTFVIAGLAVLCYGCSSASAGFQNRLTDANTDEQLKAAAQKMQDSIPSWITAWSITVAVVSLLASATVIILLALPASNQFFRKQEPEFVPYPQYPQYPQMPPAQGTQPPAEGTQPTAPEGTPPAP
jgi:hypothetical protein